MAKSCNKKKRVALLFAVKTVHLRVLLAQGKLVLKQVTQLPCMALLPRNYIQSEVSINTRLAASFIFLQDGFEHGW